MLKKIEENNQQTKIIKYVEVAGSENKDSILNTPINDLTPYNQNLSPIKEENSKII